MITKLASQVKLRAMRSYSRAIPAMAAILLLLAVGPAAAQKETPAPETASEAKKDRSVYAELGKAPQKAIDRPNPMAGDPDAVAAGGKLYDLHCAECHGDLADGGKKGPSLRAEEVQQATPGTIFWVLTNGVVRRGMPVWSKLPEPQRWQLVSYIKSLTPAPKPNPERGKAAADSDSPFPPNGK